MARNEEEFFKNVRLFAQTDARNAVLEEPVSAIYIADTSNLRLSSMTLNQTWARDAEKWRVFNGISKENVMAMASDAIKQISSTPQDRVTGELINACFTASVIAMGLTQTFAKVMADRSADEAFGHWVYIGYMSKDGTYTLRPYYQEGSPSYRIFTGDELVDIVREIVNIDMDPLHQTNVAKVLHAHGGPVLSQTLLEI